MIDQILDNRYKITRQIGAGGMAWVYLAEDLRDKRQVAVKVLYPQFAEDSTYTQRFHREAKLALDLVDDHLVSVLDYGADRDTQYLVMEYVNGEVLDDYLQKRGALPWREAVEIALQVARALEIAHKLNIVHRDIKPGNLILSDDGTVRVLDFGLARVLDLPSLTQSGFLGSPSHVSPEQATGKKSDIRSDIYSLGVVLYQMLAGQPPFEAENAWSVIGQHIASPLPPLRERAPKVPAAVEETVHRMLAKDPNERYQTPAELSIELHRLLEAKAGPSRNTASKSRKRKGDKTKTPARSSQGKIKAAPPARYEESIETGDDWLAGLKADEDARTPEPAETSTAQATTDRRATDERPAPPRKDTWKYVLGIVAVITLLAAGIWGIRASSGVRALNQAYQRATQSIEERDWPAALKELNWIMEQSPDFRDAEALRARVEEGLGVLENYQQGLVAYRAQRWGDAIAIWKPLVGQEGNWDRDALANQLCSAYRRQAQQLLDEGTPGVLPEQIGRWERIQDFYAEANEMCPDDDILSRDRHLANLYLESLQARERGDWDVSIGLLEEILDIQPAYMTTALSEQLYRVLVQRGKARLQEGEQAGAEEDFLRALDLPVDDRGAAWMALNEIPKDQRVHFTYPEPKLIAPANETIIGGGEGAVFLLEWEPVAQLAADEFYNVTIMHFENGKPVYWGDAVREPRKRLDRSLASFVGLDRANEGVFYWWVDVKKDANAGDNQLDGPSISPDSVHFSFIWQQ